MPIKRVGPNKQVGWILLNTFVCLCVCFFLHVSLVPNKRVYSSIWHPRVYDWQKNLKNSNFLLLFSSCPVAVPGNSRTGQAAKIPYLYIFWVQDSQSESLRAQKSKSVLRWAARTHLVMVIIIIDNIWFMSYKWSWSTV